MELKPMVSFTKSISKLFSISSSSKSCSNCLISMLRAIKLKLRRLRWPLPRGTKAGVVIRQVPTTRSSKESQNHYDKASESTRPIRIATFNAAMFSMAPAVPGAVDLDIRGKAAQDKPRSILIKQPTATRSMRRVSINLPDDEISVERSKDKKGKAPVASLSSRSVLDVLKEVGADVFALQNVRAEEEKGMRPLSDLAAGLGMRYVFAESWAPEYGNAVLSRWPIKQWKAQKIFDDSDFRNVLKATIEIPNFGLLHIHCTHLDHLDESWRMKQVRAILQAEDGPHILLGGLNSLDETDYSAERWLDIVKYYEETGKPTPKVEVMKFLKGKQYVDAKNYAGECEAVVVVAKGQDVQGTCKYGTRVDYILASPNSRYEFAPGSYGVVSSKGTSDHHIVKADVLISNTRRESNDQEKPKQRVVKIGKESCKGIWRINS